MRSAAPRGLLRLAALAAVGVAVALLGPAVLDRYSVNILVRSFLYGGIAVTVRRVCGQFGPRELRAAHQRLRI